MTDPSTFTVGVAIRAIKAEPAWWLESAIRLAQAGYDGIWCWDHLMGRRDITDPVVEAWTILSMTAARTERVTVGPFVANVMNRHPGVLAKMASTLQIASGGRLVLGMGIGGGPVEHAAYGKPYPETPERVRHLTEAVATIRALWTGGPVVPRFRPASPCGMPPRSRSPTAAALSSSAARRPRGRDSGPDRRRLERVRRELGRICRSTWTRSRPAGRRREEQLVLVGFQGGDWLSDEPDGESEWVREPRAARERWAEAGADGAVVLARSTADANQLVDAVGRG